MKKSAQVQIIFMSIVLLTGILLAAEIDPEQPAPAVEGKQLDVFVMSYCPFARAAEAGLLKFMNTLPSDQSFEINFHYIFYKVRVDDVTSYTCLHGEKEVQENLVQMMIRDFAPEYFHAYLLARSTSGDPWQELAAGAGLSAQDIEHIQTAITTVRDELIEREYADCSQLYKIRDGSPAFVWNGQRIKDLADIDLFKAVEFNYMGVRCSPNGTYEPKERTENQRNEMQQRAAQKEALQPAAAPAPEPYAAVAEDVKDSLLKGRGEQNPGKFRGLQIGQLLVFHYQRRIGAAEVEKDFIVYHFDRQTHEHEKTLKQWRDDLPQTLPPVISMQAALAKVKNPDGAKLVYISPESDIFPLDPVPTNPCWVVRNITDGQLELIVIDAVTGKELGFGITPPATAYSMTGPTAHPPCSGNWNEWADSAQSWYNTMGYSTDRVTWPTRANVQSHIQSSSIAMFYELAHGGSTYFSSGCQLNGNDYENTYATDIGTWIATYSKMPFAFIGSCEGLCNTGDNNFAFEFSKGTTADTVSIGYCHMDATYCDSCWGLSISWQNKLFERMNAGDTIRQAFDTANATYPACVGDPSGDCTRFYGDTTLKAKPLRKREPDCGDTVTGDVTLTRNLYCTGNGLVVGDINLTIDCQGHMLDGNGTGYGIVNSGYNNITIKNCTIREFDTGIYLYGTSDYNKLEFNTIHSNTGHGIYLDDSYNADLNQNSIHSNGYNGLYLYDSKFASVLDNDIRTNGWHGLQIKPETGVTGSGNSNTFESNYLYDNGWSGAGIDTGYNTFTGDSANSNAAYGFHVSGATNNTFTDVDALTNVEGFYINTSTFTTITSTVVNNTDVMYSKDYAVHIVNSSDTRVEKSYLFATAEDADSELDTAVYVTGSTGTVISYNTINQNERGVYIYNSDGTTIGANSFSANQTVEVILQDSDTCSISGNTMAANTGSGLQLFSSSNNIIENNTVTNPTNYGLFMNASALNTVSGNTITGCGAWGVYAITGSNSNDFASNTITTNTGGVFVTGSTGNEFTGNTVCTSVNQDFNIAVDSAPLTTGNNNTCDSVVNYADIGQASACDFGCSGCRRLEDEVSVTTNMTVCPGTYSVTHAGSLGVVHINAAGITLDGSGATLIGPSADSGYGIISDGYNNVTIKNFTIKNYFVLVDGKNGSNIQVLNNRIDGAAAGIRFWAVSDGLIKNNIVTHTSQHGCLLTSGSSNGKLIYNTLADNYGSGAFCGHGSSGILCNSILWNNTPQIVMATSSGPSQMEVSYCDIEGGKSDVSVGVNCTLNFGWGIIDANPLFAGREDYHLQSQAGRWNTASSTWVMDTVTSRAIDAGNPSITLPYEPVGAANLRVNLGAYANTAEASKTPEGWSLLTDINTDGIVDMKDFMGMSSMWLLSDAWEKPCDFTRGGAINMTDLTYMFNTWLSETTWH